MKLKYFILSAFTMLLLFSCKKQEPKTKDETTVVSVKVNPVEEGNITDIIQLNAKTVFLKKNSVQSPISGYVTAVKIKYGDFVKKNDVLFEIQSKESRALGETDKEQFGLIKVRATSAGFVNELSITEAGGFISEGATLCSIVENKNVTVQANVPYEYNSTIKTGTKCKILLSDKTSFSGTVIQILPTIDAANQTQQVLIQPQAGKQLPENLNVGVEFQKVKRGSGLLVPKSAIMTNEKQTEFWVMKISSKNMAVKIPVNKISDNENSVEISSLNIHKNDLIITDGAYGMSDSTKVRITKNP